MKSEDILLGTVENHSNMDILFLMAVVTLASIFWPRGFYLIKPSWKHGVTRVSWAIRASMGNIEQLNNENKTHDVIVKHWGITNASARPRWTYSVRVHIIPRTMYVHLYILCSLPCKSVTSQNIVTRYTKFTFMIV